MDGPDIHKINNILDGIKRNKEEETLKNIPVATAIDMPYLSTVSVEIPANFVQLTSTNFETALKWRESTRIIFSEYINNRNYIVSNCYSIKTKDNHKTFYILEKL